MKCYLCDELEIKFESQRTTKLDGRWVHRVCASKEVERRLTTPQISDWQILFSQNGNKSGEATSWLATSHARLFVVQAESYDPKPENSPAYRVWGYAARREHVLSVLAELPRSRGIRELYGFEAVGL